jgi:hypothetical protein
MKDEKQKLPAQIYVDKAAIKEDQLKVERLVEAVADISNDLEREEIVLDDKLLDQFVQNGTVAIYNRLLEFSGESKAVSLMAGNLTAAANRIAASFEPHFRRLERAFLESGYNQEIVKLINGKPSLKEDFQDQIRKKNTYTIETEEDLELYNRLSDFVENFNSLRKWIKTNRPETADLVRQTEMALTDSFYIGNKIVTDGEYLINKPNEARDDFELQVNPLFFGS